MTQGSFTIPHHVAIVMDGNGRWAKQRGENVINGHKAGIEALERTVRAAGELGVKVLTVYAFSTENWNRPKAEVWALMELMRYGLKKYTPALAENGVRLRFVGSREGFSKSLVAQMESCEDATAGGTLMTFCVAFNYGARQEIVDAVKAYTRDAMEGIAQPSKLDWPELSRYLYTRGIPDPDLFIRTSGEQRISNFLLLQMAYTELVISPVLWPDFGKADLESAIAQYNSRTRRFGRRIESVTAQEQSLPF